MCVCVCVCLSAVLSPQIETYDKHKLAELLVKYDVRTPVMGNAVSPPMEFNLMFGTAIGPGGNLAGWVWHLEHYTA